MNKSKLSVEPLEKDICKAFFSAVLMLEGLRQMIPGAYFLHIPNGQRAGACTGGRRNARGACTCVGCKRRMIAGGIDRSMGAISGTADYLFKRPGLTLWLEAKTKTGRQSPEQKAFQEKVEKCGDTYHLFRSVDQGLDILKQEGFFVERGQSH